MTIGSKSDFSDDDVWTGAGFSTNSFFVTSATALSFGVVVGDGSGIVEVTTNSVFTRLTGVSVAVGAGVEVASGSGVGLGWGVVSVLASVFDADSIAGEGVGSMIGEGDGSVFAKVS
jgi:hypothetical protein